MLAQFYQHFVSRFFLFVSKGIICDSPMCFLGFGVFELAWETF
ncbi:hypothetical protein HBZC1_04390 [Helicobacter bizzozeronii CIII-1]|uniref:Uncharacterized protein n=1 Tax=Helicobacter bizzozeronii (strain CIII-1) TaxID=1002804 RepID=F8KRN8_HELBC|nr:hypothetical protein HBZC1_04390 [Helicobacter bizzozeronii CIII-1]CCF80012.1 hypothetical protein HBZS_104600 [Helicobacter bizzozeronii CCUG 35545]